MSKQGRQTELFGGHVLNLDSGEQEERSLFISGGRLMSSLDDAKEWDRVDCHGLFLIPGLVDSHVHFSQTGLPDGRPDSLDLTRFYPFDQVVHELQTTGPQRFFPTYLGSGVTSVMDVGGFPWTFDMARASVNNPNSPNIAVTGPLLSTIEFKRLNPGQECSFLYVPDEDSARARVRYLVGSPEHGGLGSPMVKIWFIPRAGAFEQQSRVVQAATEEAKALGARVCVHATGRAEALRALMAGCDYLVHSVEDAPLGRDFIQRCLRQHTILCPTLTVMEGYTRLTEVLSTGTAPVLDDPNHLVDAITRARAARLPELVDEGARARMTPARLEATQARTAKGLRQASQNLLALVSAGVPVCAGTDAGNPLTLHGVSIHRELEAMQAAGLSPLAVLRAATRNGALAMGRPGELGDLRPGAAADVVALRADPIQEGVRACRQVEWVVRAGVRKTIGQYQAQVMHTDQTLRPLLLA
ncbi:putative Amidohydrolase family [Paratrimastix pyriformis]|uniref:Amidohydrolase family n=1 Tax=Paratrimastix pyriformis TaxID=342808 RepID=A0ABQ8UCU9_9EUKA|nr:putative Amidohydrolase family [Paratrimastix pyriformis]